MSEFNKTPSANRLHIGLFGRRNAGKSSLMNALLGQDMAIISPVKGTTTDPVTKSMEMAPIGPIVLVDTPGFDDNDPELGQFRVQKTLQILGKTDMALLVIDSEFLSVEKELITLFQKKEIPFLVVMNKIDEISYPKPFILSLWEKGYHTASLSAKNREGIPSLFDKIVQYSPKAFESPSILGDLITPKSIVLLVMPIDDGMPRGRLILPQVQTIRDILDNNAIVVSCKETELDTALKSLSSTPSLVVTDSQVFDLVSKKLPETIPLTSFSILFARLKGDLELQYEGAKTLRNLRPNAKIFMAEACTHLQQEQDIATVKIPQWVRKYIGPDVTFEFSNGTGFPLDLKDYDLVIHCGGCMINRSEMQNRIHLVEEAKVPVTNYGLAIASMFGILDRAMEPFQKKSNSPPPTTTL